jgi:hypothetical protein
LLAFAGDACAGGSERSQQHGQQVSIHKLASGT